MAFPSIKLILVTIILSASGSLHFGYQIIILNPTQSIFREFLDSSFQSHYGYFLSTSDYSVLWSMILNMTTFGCLIGTLLSLKLLPKYGRKPNFYISILISSVGCSLCAISYYTNAWELLAAGRLIAGTAMGIALCLQPLYFTEISPDDCRGFLNTITSCLVEFGFGMGSIIALPILLGTTTLWPWLFWIELIPNAAALIVLPFLMESPKVILASQQDYHLAEKSLKFFHHKNIAKDMKNIQEEIQLEKDALGIRDLFKKSYLRKGVLVSCMIQVAIQFSGINVLSYFSTLLFLNAGLSSTVAVYATVGVSLQTGIGTIVTAFLTDRVGRRPLLLTGLLIMDIVNVIFVIFLSLKTDWAGYICIAGAVLFNLMFGIGPCAVQFSITSELMPYNAKSAAQSFTMFIGWISFAASTLMFLPLANIIQQYIFLIFIITLTVTLVYFYFSLPETKNKTILEIVGLLGYKYTRESSFVSQISSIDGNSQKFL